MSKTNFCIPKPCHEDWNLMTPKEQGRYCDSCDKVVTDFTKMSKEEIILYLKTHQNVCGTFQKSQLPNLLNINVPIYTLKENRHNVYRLFFLALLISMGSSLFSCKNDQQTLGEIKLVEETDSLETKQLNANIYKESTSKADTKDSSMHCSAKSRAELIAEKMKEEDFITGEVLPPLHDYQNDKESIIDPGVNEKLNKKDTLTWD